MATTTTTAKPALSALKTPISATYPSEVRSPMVQTPTVIKREDGQQTPITPPAAYLDFLKTLSPVLMSPLPTGASTKFTFGDRPSLPETRPRSTSSIMSLASTASTSSSLTSTSGAIPADRPSPTSSVSSRSSSCNCDPASPPASASFPAPIKTEKKADMNIVIPPPSPFVRPMSARTPRLFIPQSPYSAGMVVQSPMSAHSVRSPYSATMSPRTWDFEKKSTTSRRVSVREVVTRTVTYSRTPVETSAPAFPPLDPAPKGKRRKIE